MFQALVGIMLRDRAGENGCSPGSRGAVSPSCTPPLCWGLEVGAPSGSGVWCCWQGAALCLSCLAWVFQCRCLLAEGWVQLTKA